MAMILTKRCPLCNEAPDTLIVATSEYHAYIGGSRVHRAFPNMDPYDRERVVSGICRPCLERVAERPGVEVVS